MEIVSNEQRLALLEDAQNVWENGILNAKSSFKIDPTAYLKLFQLENPGSIVVSIGLFLFSFMPFSYKGVYLRPPPLPYLPLKNIPVFTQ